MSSKKRPGGDPARAGLAEDAREARRAKAAALRQRELARERSRRVLLVSVAVVAVLALVAVVVVLVARERDAATTTAGATPPSASGGAGGYVLPGEPAAGAPSLDVWLDYQCPYCARFEAAAGDAYVQLAASGRARVVVHTLSFLDDSLRNDSSTRAAEGAAAADAQGRFAEYTRAVFARQPQEEGDGYSDEQLREAAREAGVADLDRWQRALDDDEYAGYVRRVQDGMGAAGVSGTPTVQITPEGGATTALDTEQLLGADPAGYLQQQVAAAAAS
ncbi:DsbA family protein [Kineococcus indalonis]|uniref:DsbA family protein n=1 Tax=Kineococcus indalonis TaxID=2696566 RepID=UPI001412DDC8|nr:thioredoxin domain-containing protein [Kineococcus indalonis]NAZ85534.1 thioredoxin domain-containing protein [Kineococcus indalonis]